MKPSEIITKNATENAFNHEPTAADFVMAILNYLDEQNEAKEAARKKIKKKRV